MSCNRAIDTIIVHCSATPAGRDNSAADIRRWHRQRGFSDIGYHFVVRLDGTIEAGRPLELPGAHCRGHNLRSIGVCYDTRTPAQRASLLRLLTALHLAHPRATIRGHRDFAAKACPCFDATREYRLI